MTKYEHYLSGKVFGIKYVFETDQDGLPAHIHEADTAHNICVLRGEVLLLFENSTQHLSAGDVCDFDWNQKHWILAVTPNACILNLFLNGQPEEYETLPASERKGEFDIRDFNR